MSGISADSATVERNCVHSARSLVVVKTSESAWHSALCHPVLALCYPVNKFISKNRVATDELIQKGSMANLKQTSLVTWCALKENFALCSLFSM